MVSDSFTLKLQISFLRTSKALFHLLQKTETGTKDFLPSLQGLSTCLALLSWDPTQRLGAGGPAGCRTPPWGTTCSVLVSLPRPPSPEFSAALSCCHCHMCI